jgi:hypothetical protein
MGFGLVTGFIDHLRSKSALTIRHFGSNLTVHISRSPTTQSNPTSNIRCHVFMECDYRWVFDDQIYWTLRYSA